MMIPVACICSFHRGCVNATVCRIRLFTLTGKKKLQASYENTQAFLEQKIAGLSIAELETVSTAMHLLQALFVSEREVEMGLMGEHK